ncbi:hypothetical protein [Streptomyces somaliensis]|uniref:hypothetical protein n=1 Tax=Streptomyces somaliensis TaxID=78355 RepID=UPI003F74E751|nr:hypothetical protein [Streptomyces somaliensis]
MAQTWQGQTWDTHYQPTVRPGQPPHGPDGLPIPPEAPVSHGRAAPAGYEAPTAYLPPVVDQGAGPVSHGHAAPAGYEAPTAYLPPVVDQGAGPVSHGHAAPAGYEAPTAYLPPVVDHGPAPVPHGRAAPVPGQAAPAHARAPRSGAPVAPAPVHTPAHAPDAPAAGPEYGAPTTLGNTRITDAQRARAEGRSPIIDPGIQPAGLTALLGVLLAGGAFLGPYALLVPLVLLQAVTAAGWFRLNGMWPARQGIALAFLGGAVADAALLATGPEHAPAAILGTLGVWVLLVLVLQLRSRAAAEERMYGLTATVVSSALAVVAAGFLAADPDAVVAGALAVAAATVVRALPLPGPASPVAALLAAAGAGAAAGAATGPGAQAAVVGLAAGACAVVGLRVAAYDYPSRFVHMTAGVALPLAFAAPAAYLLGRVLA